MANQYGDVIRRLRKERAWSQEELAENAQVGRELVVRAEQSGNVGVFMLQRMAHALDVEISAFFAAKPTKPPNVWGRLGREQRRDVLKYAYRLLGERVPLEEIE